MSKGKRFKGKFYTWLAWLLPRRLAQQCFIRVATEGCNEFPADQTVSEVLKRWKNDKEKK